MGFFDRPLFDFNRDGKVVGFETYVGLQMMASSRQEAIDRNDRCLRVRLG